MADGPCPHIKPRLDGAAMGPCEECKPPNPNRFPAFTFRYGRETFHGPTIGEQLEHNRKIWEADGTEVESTTRWV